MPRTRRGELSRLNKDLSNLQDWVSGLPTHIGNAYLNFFLDRFKAQGWIEDSFHKWPKRVDNTGRNANRALLVSSGRLRRSLRMRVKGQDIIFSTALPYAQIHNEGGRIKKNVRVRPYSRRRKGKTEKVKGHNRKIDTNMPQRQFMGGSPFMDRRIIKNLERELKKLLG
jgi:phage gpG-like protein